MTSSVRRASTALSFKVPLTSHTTLAFTPFSTTRTSCSDSNSVSTANDSVHIPSRKDSGGKEEHVQKPRKKTVAELDEELRLKMEGMSGDGGSAGVEYENGKAEGLKRAVKDNMFRVI